MIAHKIKSTCTFRMAALATRNIMSILAPTTSAAFRAVLFRTASTNIKIKEIGKISPTTDADYAVGQTFVHKIFGYRAIVLYAWTAKVHDRNPMEPRELPNEKNPEKYNFSGVEMPAVSTTYYQVLVHRDDLEHVNVCTDMICFVHPMPTATKGSEVVKGFDYVSHDEMLPYKSKEPQPVSHHLFGTFFKKADTEWGYEPSEYLQQWREKGLSYLEQSSVHRETTEDIRITMIPFYMGHQQIGYDKLQHVWRYCVRMENLNALQQPVTLRERQWKIYSTGEKMKEVNGRGVIGYEPNLCPSTPSFQYNSYVTLQSASGHMWGIFRMERNKDGTRFDCRIPAISLESPPSDRAVPPIISM